MTALHDRLTNVFRTVFNNPNIEISRDTTANDIEGWDSITHLDLITGTEEEFGIEITGFDVMNLKNVGDLLDLLERKSAS
jgi:acyl carrier protein